MKRRPPNRAGALTTMGEMPSREAIAAFIKASPGRVGKREIIRHFKLGPDQRAVLLGMLRDLAGGGHVAPAGHRRFAAPDRTHEAIIVEIIGSDPDGDAIARPVEWPAGQRPPRIFMAPEPAGQPALAPGQRVLARIRPRGRDMYEGRTLRRIEGTAGRIVGVFRARGSDGSGRIEPTDRRAKAEWTVTQEDAQGAQDGEVVRAEPLPGKPLGLKPARVVERLGQATDARAVSLIVIATHDIPTEFTPSAITEAEHASATPLGDRTDLRGVPLITIDGADARDFDDAVYAEPDGDGFKLIVAIADVAHYVRPGSALDRVARLRGNSCYFPDRVVPMLPEALSNGWCSLRQDEDRGCLFVEMFVGPDGQKHRHRFGRGLIRSAARLTYEQVQELRDAGTDTHLPIDTLYVAYHALLAARQRRGTLDLDLPERLVKLDDNGHVASITPRPRLDSHRLIEEFMVLANVCAAEELERLHRPCVYRVHAPPTEGKLEGLREFLSSLGIKLPPEGALTPGDLDRVLKQVAGTSEAPLVNEMTLRSQSQAAYDIDNVGHFGLALARYAHFTSPIRRYADLLVHRALIAGLRLGTDGLADGAIPGLEDDCAHITATERRAQLAERDAIDRYLAVFMADKVGTQFPARISGVTRFGLFVTLAESGASGLVPVGSLLDDFWMHDPIAQTLTGRRTGMMFRLAQEVDVLLSEASPVTGGLLFHILQGNPGKRPLAKGGRGRP
jgi:ribonuclease R